jgi:hypothetical protein
MRDDLKRQDLGRRVAAANIALTGQRHLFLEERSRGLIDCRDLHRGAMMREVSTGEAGPS